MADDGIFARWVEALTKTTPELRCEVVDGREVWAVRHAGLVRTVRGGRRSAEIYAEALLNLPPEQPNS